MVLFSLEKVLHLVEMTLDLNIELLDLTIVTGGVGGIWKWKETVVDGKGMDIRERRDRKKGYQPLRTKILHMGLMPRTSKLCPRHLDQASYQ
jgi:hypothetical protein